MKYHKRVAVAVDQLGNAVLGGWPDETLSSRAWRKRNVRRRWALLQRGIDMLFFWQKDHCKKTYLLEVQRRQGPREFRG